VTPRRSTRRDDAGEPRPYRPAIDGRSPNPTAVPSSDDRSRVQVGGPIASATLPFAAWGDWGRLGRGFRRVPPDLCADAGLSTTYMRFLAAPGGQLADRRGVRLLWIDTPERQASLVHLTSAHGPRLPTGTQAAAAGIPSTPDDTTVWARFRIRSGLLSGA
jgi:hypothetical protein